MKTTPPIRLIVFLSFLLPTLLNGQTTIINENFSGGSLPSGWSNSDYASTGDIWLFNDPDNRNISAGNFSGGYAIIDSDYYGSSSNQNTGLVTPSFNASLYTNVTLSFDYQYRDYDGPESCRVQVYNGSSWTTVLTYNIGDENYSGSNFVSLDITSVTNGSANAKVRFRYKGAYDWWWAIDNVKITGTEPSLVSSPKGPGGIGSDDGTSGLKLWLDVNTISGSDGSTITNWTDASGNSFNFSAGNGATYIESAQNNYSAFRFNGSSSYFQRAFTADLTPTSFTIFTANKVNSSSNYKCVISNRDDPSGSATAGFILYSRPSTNYWDFWTGRSAGSWQTNSGNTSTAGSWASQMIRYDGTTNGKTLDIKGAFDATNTHTMTSNSSQPIRVGAGRNESTPDYYFNGDIGEVILFNTVLSEVEEIIINNYLSAKYNFSLSANDYYTQDNSGSGNFDHHVAGIGRASDGSLHNNSQGTGIVKINNPSDLNFDEFLFWGEDTKDSDYSFSTSSTYTERQSSTWRVSKRNDLGTVSVSVNESDLDLSGKQGCASLYLIVSNSSSFASKTSYAMTLSSGVYTADNVTFSNGSYFSFEYIDQIVVDNTQFYNGDGSSNVPNTTNACYKLLVKATATGALPITENAEVREIEVETGGVLTINSGIYLSLAGNIVNNGTINIEEETSLIQTGAGTDNNSGSGIYNVKRSGNNSSYVYNIWSSPIQSATLTSVFTGANPCDIWVFDKDNQAWKYDFAAGFSTTCNGNSVTSVSYTHLTLPTTPYV